MTAWTRPQQVVAGGGKSRLKPLHTSAGVAGSGGQRQGEFASWNDGTQCLTWKVRCQGVRSLPGGP